MERCGESVRQERRMREWMGRSVGLQELGVRGKDIARGGWHMVGGAGAVRVEGRGRV